VTNRQIVLRFLRAISAQDTAVLRSVLMPQARLSFMIAGVYSPQLQAFQQGTQWSRDEMIKREIDFQQRLDGAFTLQILSLITEGDAVAAEVVGRGRRAATGRDYIQHYSYHFQLSNGRISDIRLYQDTFHLWDVWSDLGGVAQPPYLTAGRVAGAGGEQTDALMTEITGLERVAANKESVRRFLMAVRNRDPHVTRAAWSPEGIWSFAVGGNYVPHLRAFQGGPRWDREAMIEMQQSAQHNLREPLTLDIYSVIGEGDEVGAEAVGFLVRADGRAYRQHYSLHFKTRNGKLIEGHVYQDTLHQYDLALDRPDCAPVAAPM